MRWLLSALLLWSSAAAAQDASQPLAGLDFGQVEALLGKPDLITRDMPAEIWQYSNDVCVVHVFFYREKLGRPFAVDHIETRMRDGYADRPDVCEAVLAGQPVEETPAAVTPDVEETAPDDSAPVSSDLPPLN